jgi:hypothetical protein
VKQLREVTETYQGLAACKLVCDEYSVLWPQPTGTVELGQVLVPINYDDINIVGVSGKKQQHSNGYVTLISCHSGVHGLHVRCALQLSVVN